MAGYSVSQHIGPLYKHFGPAPDSVTTPPHALVFKTRRWPFFIKIAYFHQISTEREYYMVSNIGVLQRFVSIVKKANT